jgi:LacI family transcriptional regulator
MEELGDWIESLPKPAALLAFEGVRGRQLTEACRLRGIDVPGEVAVLGGDHDELSSRISSPKLSTIDHSPERIGFKAAELLDKMISSGKVPQEPILLPPAGVVTRQSTDTLAVDDPLIARAIHYIRENAHRPIQVRDILEQVPISRRSLELRLLQLLGHSPADEIRRARLQVARRLLLSNDEQMPWIAAHSGFERVEVLTRAFRKAFGITPSAYRRQFRR